MQRNKEKKFIQKIHNSTKRDYLNRMINEKVKAMKIASKFGYDYWDGSRKYGYGGHKFIEGYWAGLAKKLINNYNLNNKSKILDIGCGKGFLLYEIKKILPEIRIKGLDISSYAIKNSHKIIKKYLKIYKAENINNLKYKKNAFDLTISINCLHNLELSDLQKSLNEISYISKKSYIVVESYKEESELFNLQCWALTCKSFFSKREWIYLFKLFNYKGDFEFITFK